MNKQKRYYSFDEIGQELFGLKPLRRVTKDKQRLETQREKFVGTCPYCKELLRYVYGTNIVVCNNKDCKGKKITIRDGEGTEKTEYMSYCRILQGDNSSTIGSIIFDE